MLSSSSGQLCGQVSFDMADSPAGLPRLWSAEQPVLYTLVLELRSGDGSVLEAECCQVKPHPFRLSVATLTCCTWIRPSCGRLLYSLLARLCLTLPVCDMRWTLIEARQLGRAGGGGVEVERCRWDSGPCKSRRGNCSSTTGAS